MASSPCSGVLFLLFVLFFAVTDPDDIARKAVGERARPEVYAQWKKNHGYDKPLFINTQASGASRYTDTLLFEHYRRMLTFDFGRSDADDSPISRRLREGAGPSLSLTVPLFVFGLVLSVGVALFVAFFRETYVDRLIARAVHADDEHCRPALHHRRAVSRRPAAQVVSHLWLRSGRRRGGTLPGAAGPGGRGVRASVRTRGSIARSSSRR